MFGAARRKELRDLKWEVNRLSWKVDALCASSDRQELSRGNHLKAVVTTSDGRDLTCYGDEVKIEGTDVLVLRRGNVQGCFFGVLAAEVTDLRDP